MAAKPGLVSGVVRDATGRPVSEARVYFVSGPVPLPDIAALTDGDGTFSLSVPSAGTYGIECATGDGSPERATVTVPAGKEVRLEIQLGLANRR